jgi:hypothetical protein
MSGRLGRLLRLVLLVNLIGIGVALAIWLYGQEIAAVNGMRLRLAALMPRALVLPVMGLLGGAVAGGGRGGGGEGGGDGGGGDVHVWDNTKHSTAFYRDSLYRMINKTSKSKK